MKRFLVFPVFILFLSLFFVPVCKGDTELISNPSAGDRKEITVNGVKFGIRYIPSGTFMMGRSPSDDESKEETDDQDIFAQIDFGEEDYEIPQHKVRISSGFWMMETEVTQELYEAVMGTNPSYFKGNNLNYPVECVSWQDAVLFCSKLSELTGETWELPTEAEWEYACRAGSTTAYYFGDSSDNLTDYAWFQINLQDEATHPVGQKKPNAWGLYDMYGNVQEWCSDWLGKYSADDVTDPKGPQSGIRRVLRGGSIFDFENSLTSSYRRGVLPNHNDLNLGFRAVMH